jgi:chemotaxis protein MotB
VTTEAPQHRPRVPIRNPHAWRVSGDRWLLGYADIVTLLFACFAGLYAAGLSPALATGTSHVGTSHPEPDDPATPIQTQPAAVPGRPDPPDATAAPDSASPAPDELLRLFGNRPEQDGAVHLEVASDPRGVVISLPEAGSFPPGRADLSLSARVAMLHVAHTLRGLPNAVRVEGHTDDVPIETAQFASNWDLSAARATRVVRFLIDEAGLEPTRLSAAGYAEHRPRLPNVDAPSRARNRRVDIVVLDAGVAGREEPAAASAGDVVARAPSTGGLP